MIAQTVVDAAGTPAEVGGLHPHFWVYASFVGLVVAVLVLDLTVFHRHAHAVRMKEAIGWSTLYVTMALLFTGAIYWMYETHWLGFGIDVPQLDRTLREVRGLEAAKLYLTGYLIEQSLSMDNLFVMAVIFGFFRVPPQFQHRVLFWGILTAVVLRGVMIWLGATLIHNFDWIIYVFGAFLIFTAYKMAVSKENEVHPENNLAVKLVRKFFPVTPDFHEQHFFTRNSTQFQGKVAATPLLLALVMIETVDVVFAVDSIPAIFGITADPFIVFTSNIFAILGLRSLFFCLAALLDKFHYLKWSLVVILAFVGAKMLLIHTPLKINPTASLLVVLGLLALGMLASWLRPRPAVDEAVAEAVKPEEAR